MLYVYVSIIDHLHSMLKKHVLGTISYRNNNKNVFISHNEDNLLSVGMTDVNIIL